MVYESPKRGMNTRSVLQRLQKRFNIDLRYLIEGNFWLLVARVVAIGTGMVLTVLFANLLTPESFGFYKYVISLAGILGAFSLTGIGIALVNSIARGDEGILRTTLRASILWALLGSALALIAAGYYFYHHNPTLAIALIVIALTLPLSAGYGNYRHVYAGRADFKAAALVGAIRSIVPIVCIALTLFLTHDPLIIVISYFISNVVTTMVLYAYTVSHYGIPKTAESTESTLRFARFTSVLGFFSQVTSQADQFLVWHFVGPAGVAFYSLATSPVGQLQSLTGNIFALVAPRLAKKTTAEVRSTLPLRIKQMFIGVLPLTILYVIGAPYLYRVLFPTYTSVVWLSQIYALILLLQPFGLVDAMLIALEDTGKRNLLVSIGQAAKLVFLTVGIWKFGIAGGVAALIISEIFMAFLSLIILFHMQRKASAHVY
jgi:O-antigen/teichoic acid export membrane protein